MSVLVFGAVAVTGGVLAILAQARARLAIATGLIVGVLVVLLGRLVGAQDSIVLAGAVVSGSDGIRTIALAWAAGIALLGVADALVGTGRGVLGSSLIGLGAGVVALSAADAGLGFALLTAGALVAAIGPLVLAPGGPDDIETAGPRFMRPLAGAGLIALLAVAWGASPAGPFVAVGPEGATDPAAEVAVGLGLLAIATAVVIRLGALPAHVWAARFVESAPAGAIPATLGWGAAAFVLVALSWVDVTIAPVGAALATERTLIVAVAVASIVLGGVAAMLHDDVEHVLGYSIVQDAGVAILAFAVMEPEAAGAGRDWLVGMAAVKAGLAGWILVTRSTFGVRRISALRGWARSSPILGLAFAAVLGGAVGVPGMAAFAARATLVELALPAPLDVAVLLAAFAPLAYLGRILVAGLGSTSEEVRAAGDLRPTLRGLRPGGWTGASAVIAARSIPDLVWSNRFVLAASSALAVAAIGLAVAIGGLGAGEPG